MKPSDFYTRSRANAGAKMYLMDPEGKISKHYLIVCGIECDAYRNRLNDFKREKLNGEQLTEEQKVKERDWMQIELLASLVSGWSFEAEFTHEAICEFLQETPNAADLVDKFAVKRANFFKSEQTSSESLQEQSSS